MGFGGPRGTRGRGVYLGVVFATAGSWGSAGVRYRNSWASGDSIAKISRPRVDRTVRDDILLRGDGGPRIVMLMII